MATGDLTRSISVEAEGEVAELKDNINAMVQSLRETTKANQEQYWLKTNLARFAGLLQGQRDLETVAELIMNELIPLVGAQHGTFFIAEDSGDGRVLRLIAGYGLRADIAAPSQFRLGQSLIGQVAKTRKPIVVTDAPPDYVRISSGLGDAAPVNLIVLPIVFEGQVLGVIEAGSFSRFTQVHQDFLEQLMETIGVSVNTIIANSRTSDLLQESQRLAGELQSRTGELQVRQEELQSSNAELEDKAAQLASQKRDIEIKNIEIEQARQEIEERARQLDQASRYKSQFLANVSHELRTPLNSLLILARLLAQNPAQNLTPKQVEYANVIHSSGSDLLLLINDILDLSRVEAGKLDVHPEEFALGSLVEDLRSVFEPLAADKRLNFSVTVDPDVPAELVTDRQRLRQVLHNLLSNAVKFTERGEVMRPDPAGRPAGARRRARDHVLGHRHRDRHLRRQPQDHLRGVPAGRRDHQPPLRRHRPGAGHQPRGGRDAGRPDHRAEPAGPRQHLHHLPAAGRAPGRPGARLAQLSAARGTAPRATSNGHLSAETVPLAPTRPRERRGSVAAPPAKPGPHDRVRGRKVLIVDDDLRNAFAITSILELYGLHVIHAPSGRQGIEVLRSGQDIDLVLMDVMMPEMDGYATTAAIREMPQFASLPVIAVTARAMQGDRDKSLAAGASDYVTKPVDTDELLSCMERWLPPVNGGGR